MSVREGHAQLVGGVSQLVASSSTSPTALTATYLTGLRGPEYRRDDTLGQSTSGQVRWYVYDGLGSVVGEVDPSGNLTASAKYDVYGAKRAGGTGTASSRQGFVGALGHVTDSETGLVYMRARYYDPGVGRFVSEDPAGDGLNWFAYCHNDPVDDVDRDGKMDAVFWEEALKSAQQVVGDAEAEARLAEELYSLADDVGDAALGEARHGLSLIIAGERIQGEAGEDPTTRAMAGEAIKTGGEQLAASAVAGEDAAQIRVLAQLVEGPGAGLLN